MLFGKQTLRLKATACEKTLRIYRSYAEAKTATLCVFAVYVLVDFLAVFCMISYALRLFSNWFSCWSSR